MSVLGTIVEFGLKKAAGAAVGAGTGGLVGGGASLITGGGLGSVAQGAWYGAIGGAAGGVVGDGFADSRAFANSRNASNVEKDLNVIGQHNGALDSLLKAKTDGEANVATAEANLKSAQPTINPKSWGNLGNLITPTGRQNLADAKTAKLAADGDLTRATDALRSKFNLPADGSQDSYFKNYIQGAKRDDSVETARLDKYKKNRDAWNAKHDPDAKLGEKLKNPRFASRVVGGGLGGLIDPQLHKGGGGNATGSSPGSNPGGATSTYPVPVAWSGGQAVTQQKQPFIADTNRFPDVTNELGSGGFLLSPVKKGAGDQLVPAASPELMNWYVPAASTTTEA